MSEVQEGLAVRMGAFVRDELEGTTWSLFDDATPAACAALDAAARRLPEVEAERDALVAKCAEAAALLAEAIGRAETAEKGRVELQMIVEGLTMRAETAEVGEKELRQELDILREQLFDADPDVLRRTGESWPAFLARVLAERTGSIEEIEDWKRAAGFPDATPSALKERHEALVRDAETRAELLGQLQQVDRGAQRRCGEPWPEFVARLIRERDAARAVLKAVEWGYFGRDCPSCYWCSEGGEHRANCALAAALNR